MIELERTAMEMPKAKLEEALNVFELAKTKIRQNASDAKARFAEAAEHELMRNSGRLRADYQERLGSSARSFLAKFQEHISSALLEIRVHHSQSHRKTNRCYFRKSK